MMIRFIFALIFAAFCFVQTAFSQQPSIEDYAKQVKYRSATLSPDGNNGALLLNMDDGTRLIIFNREGKVTRQLSIADIKPNSLHFVNNDYLILSASETTKLIGYEGKFEYSGAISVNIKTGKSVTLLSNTKDIFPAQSGLGRILGTGTKDDTVLMRAFMGGPTASEPPNNLLTVNLGNGRGRLLRRGRNATLQWITDGQGDALARVDYENRNNRFTVRVRQDNKWETIFEEENELPSFWITGIMPDGSGLVFIQEESSENGFEKVMVLGLDGKVRGPVFAPKNKEISRIYYDRERRLVGVRYVSDQNEDYDLLDPELQASVDSLKEKIPGGIVSLLSWSDDRSRILYRIFHSGFGHIYVVHDTQSDQLQTLANILTDIPTDQLGDMYSVTYPARDGLMIPAILTVPKGVDINSAPKLPFIMMPHGGPASYDDMDYNWKAHFLANRGYAVLQPNFRGSDGYGRTFEDAGRGEWAGKMQRDLDDGLIELGKMGVIDPDQACIIGASYGGYAALVGATMTPELYKCVISIAGVSDLNAMLREERSQHGSNHWVISYWEGVMADGDARRAKLREISPITHAANAKAPILLIHGDDDTVVPMRQSRSMERALKRAKKDVTFIRLRDGDHWLSYDKNRIETLQAIDSFLKEHLPVNP